MPENRTDDIGPKVVEIIAEILERSPDSIGVDSSLKELGADSLDGMNLAFALEEEFDIEIPDDEVKSIPGVRQIIENVRQLVAERSE